MIERLTEQGTIRSGGVRAAFERVRRSAFIPDVPIDEVYADRTHVVVEDDGVAVSTVDAWMPDSAIAVGEFDLIEFTVDTWTFPVWLAGALRPGGRVIAPMGMFAFGCGWVFSMEGGRLLGRNPFGGGFVAARGAGAATGGQESVRSGDVVLDTDEQVSAQWLESVLSRQCEPVDTGVWMPAGSQYLPVFLRLLSGSERAGTIRSASRSKGEGFPGASWMRTPVWLAGDGLAVMDHVPAGDGTAVFVRGFGSDGPDLAARMARRLRDWPASGGGPVLEAYPVGKAPQDVPDGTRILRREPWEFRLRWEALPGEADLGSEP